jgi:SAM-dependent methyltransferase
MNHAVEFDQSYADEQLRRARHPLRRLIKRFYLGNILREVKGATIDFGCGAGQLLRRLPQGSIGLEINPCLVQALRSEGLHVELYDAGNDDFGLSPIAAGRYNTLVMAHVLEHFAEAAEILRKLLRSCKRIGVGRVIVVVPGAKGYRSDRTHKTFVSRRYVEEKRLRVCEGYSLTTARYFPLNLESVGEVFVFHELVLVYDASQNP